ncbi:MAG: hypothetical protein ACI9GM_000702 [Salibacteraceae bacterium]
MVFVLWFLGFSVGFLAKAISALINGFSVYGAVPLSGIGGKKITTFIIASSWGNSFHLLRLMESILSKIDTGHEYVLFN